MRPDGARVRDPFEVMMVPSSDPVDFRALDFERLWAGRDLTTAVERAVVGELLQSSDPGRVLEVGPGAGRISPVLLSRFREYVALDLHPEFLARLPLEASRGHVLRVVADARRAPFVDGAFDVLVAVRVFNFFPEPGAFLREAFRLLHPGGRLVLGYQPRPSVATLVDDVRNGLSGRRSPASPTMTFSRRDRVPATPSSFPAWLPTRAFVRAGLAAAGFRVEESRSTGLEDYAPGRRLPAEWFVRHAAAADRVGWLPTQFLLAEAGAENPGRSRPAWAEIARCPSCGNALHDPGAGSPRDERCPSCGADLRLGGGWFRPGPAPPSAAAGSRGAEG